MTEDNKATLLKGNAAIAEGNYEEFIALCTDDTEWTFVGDTTFKGKEAVRQWMARSYTEPPKVTVDDLIAEGDFLTAVGMVTMKDENSKAIDYSYCDVWRFRNGKLAELKAFVIKAEPHPQDI
jgi:ketosteroid isomerase-like protein